jgi:hypothetical protein
MLRLVGTMDRNSYIFRLFRRKDGQLHAKLIKMETGNLFIQFLGKTVDVNIIIVLPEVELSQGLI